MSNKTVFNKTARALLAVLMFFSCALPLAAAGGSACNKGDRDAVADTETVKFWYMAYGCLLGPIGAAMGYIMPPSIPADRLAGKTSEYIESYTKCYNETAVNVNGPMSMVGCGVFSLAVGATLFVALVVMPFMNEWNSF